MPRADKDEIMFLFASSQEDLVKYASNANLASNVAKALGVEAAVTAGIAGIGAGVGAASATGTAAGGALAALGLTPPIGWMILGGALLVGGLGYALYTGLSQTDDNLNDLVDRLEDLDIDGTSAEATVTEWISALNGYKAAIRTPGLGEPNERVKQQMEQLLIMKKLVSDLKLMQQDWPTVKNTVQDWKWTGSWGDIGEAETTLNQTTAAMEQTWKQMQSSADAAIKKVVADAQKKSGVDYMATAKSIMDLHKKLTDAGGGEPTYNHPWEQGGFALAKNLTTQPQSVDVEKINENFGNMVRLKTVMEQGLAELQKKKTEQATKTETKPKGAKGHLDKPPISKRALILGDGTEVGVPQKGKGKGVAQKGKKRKGGRIYNMTIGIQKAINHLAAKYVPQMARIAVDGVYGPQTGNALSALMQEAPEIRSQLENRAGVSIRTVQDPRDMRGDPEAISGIYSVLSAALGHARSGGEAGVAGREPSRRRDISQRQRGEFSATPCPEYKDNLNSTEIDSCLRNMEVVWKGERMSAHRFLKYVARKGTPEQRAAIVYDAFGAGSAGGMPRASEWTEWGRELVEYVSNRYRGKYRAPGSVF